MPTDRPPISPAIMRRPWCRWGLVCLLVLLAGVGTGGPAWAYDENPRQYGFSTDQLRKVGNFNGELSKLCRLGRFNQRRIAEYFLAFGGDTRDLIGIAKQNYNLYDPLGKADPAQTYHFHYDGTSQCKVFVAP